jgi:hypothetical protein
MTPFRNGFSALLALLACVPLSALGQDSSTYVKPEVKLLADPVNGKGVTFKTIESDDQVDHLDYAIESNGNDAAAGVVKSQPYPFGVFFKNTAGQRVHTIVRQFSAAMKLC